VEFTKSGLFQELGFCSAWTLLYLISSILCADYASLDAAYGVASVSKIKTLRNFELN
jgi:hypothetical protein